jgi:hypothetical protein
MKTRNLIPIWLVCAAGLLHAQETATPVQGGTASVNSMSDTEVMLQAIESVPPSPASTVQRGGTFYSAKHAPGTRLAWPPLPGNMNQLPVWNLGDGVYLLDDLQENDSAPLMPSRMAGGMGMAADGPVPPGFTGGGGSGTNVFYSDSFNFSTTNYGTNLWLEITNVGNQQFRIIAHNPVQDWIQLFSKTNLTDNDWTVAEDNYSSDTNDFEFNMVGNFNPGATNSQTFFWAEQSVGLVGVEGGGDVVRPSPGLAPVPAIIMVNYNPADGLLNSNLVVHFSLSGTATNGVDYVLRNNDTGGILTNSITILANNSQATIELDPTTNLLCLTNLTVILTLDDSPDYLVDSDFYNVGLPATTNTIIPNVFSLVASVPAPCGIDYHPPTSSLIVSTKDDSGVWSFKRIGANGVVTNWSGVQFSMSDEVKLATVKTTANGFTNGAMFFDSSETGTIGWLSSDGTASNLDFFVTSGRKFWGLYIDQSGRFGGNLIALQDNIGGDGGVWRINGSGALVTNYPSAGGVEGVISLANDTNRFGPLLAGSIFTGSYAIATNGAVTQLSGFPPTEDCDIIQSNQNLYCNDDGDGWVLKVPYQLFANHVGDLLITDSGFYDFRPALYIVHWDATNGIVQTQIPMPGETIGAFEHVTFAPIDIPAVSPPITP